MKGMPLSELGELKLLGGAGDEPFNMTAGCAATGAPITERLADVEPPINNSITDLVIGAKPSLNV